MHAEPDNRRPFIALEFTAGPTLDELIRREGALNVDWALAVADSLARALQSAHDCGHPLGLARQDVRQLEVRMDDARVVLYYADSTDPGTTRGTPAYLAPERVLGQPADLRSDLFTLAAILYEMLCSAPPFESIVDFAHVRITERVADLAPAFDAFFERALAKRPEDRFHDGASFRDALASLRQAQERFRYEGAFPAVDRRRPASRRAVRGAFWSVAAIVLVILFMVAMVWILRPRRSSSVPPAALGAGDARAEAPAVPAPDR